MKNPNYAELKSSNNKISLNDNYGRKVIMGSKPIFTHENGVNVFKVMVIGTLKGKRVMFDKYSVTDLQTPFIILNGKTIPNKNYKAIN